MAGYQRMMTALRRGQPDRVPIWELIVDRPVIEALYGDISYHEFVEREGLDGVTVFEDQRIEELGNSLSRDEWGIVWRVDTPGIPYRIAGPIKSQADLDGYVPPDPDADHRLKTLEAAVKRFKGERAIVFLGHDGFEFSHYLYGMENLLVSYHENPELAHRLARLVVDYKKRVLERAIEIGADIGLTGDDYANRLGPLWSILDGLIDTGLHALDPLEPIAHMDIGEVKRRYGDRIAVAGNVDCGELLCRGSVEEVVEAVKETIAKAAPGGGHIVASSNSIHPGVKPQNYRAMLEAGRRFGTYPLDSNTVAKYRERSYIARYGDR
jgi:uroporphyrinogen decarboxylase